MNELKPCGADIYFKYVCECGCKHLKTLDEIQKVGKDLCFCGKVIHFKYISKAKVKLKYSSKPITKISAKTIGNKINEDLISGLVNLGYKSREATKIVNDYVNQNKYCGNFNTYFTSLLQNLCKKSS